MTTIATKMLVKVRNLATGESCEFSPFCYTAEKLIRDNEWEDDPIVIQHSDDYGMTWKDGES